MAEPTDPVARTTSWHITVDALLADEVQRLQAQRAELIRRADQLLAAAQHVHDDIDDPEAAVRLHAAVTWHDMVRQVLGGDTEEAQDDG